ncbi:hypothetical protein D3C78_1076630 [compost metagenome]
MTIVEAKGETLHIAIQSGMTDEQPGALPVAVVHLHGKQIIANLEALDVAVERRVDRAGPALPRIPAVYPGPTRR